MKGYLKRFGIIFFCGVALLTAIVVLATGCGNEQSSGDGSPFALPTPTPPPFQYDTVRIAAGEVQIIHYDISSEQVPKGKWCFEYEVDLIQEGSRNNLDLNSYVSLPTGEQVRQVTINSLNSPIRGKVYADQAGRYAVALDNTHSLFSSKTAKVKSRMYFPC